MLIRTLRDYLNRHHVAYEAIPHDLSYTAQHTAQSAHIPGKEMAKSVVVRADGKLVLAVVPASETIDLEHFREEVGALRIELAREDEFAAAFPGCELGAMPPFGNLFGLAVYVDSHLTEDEHIAFNAGSHTEVVRLAYRDFERLVRPIVFDFCLATV